MASRCWPRPHPPCLGSSAALPLADRIRAEGVPSGQSRRGSPFGVRSVRGRGRARTLIEQMRKVIELLSSFDFLLASSSVLPFYGDIAPVII